MSFSRTEFDFLEPHLLYAFEADPDRANWLDQRMRSRLADSLAYVFDQGHGLLDVSQTQFTDCLLRIREKAVSPLIFSYYCDIVLALEEDEVDEASRLLNGIISFPDHPGGLSIREMGDRRTDAISDRIGRFVDSDPETPFEIFPPTEEGSARCRLLLDSAFDLMKAGDPALFAEIHQLLREITLLSGNPDSNGQTFDGASSIMLWGGIVINVNHDDGTLGMVELLAHESAHNLLFGFCVDGPVLSNGFAGRYSSPLRKDPRPLEGIYHATFVVARMHRAVKTLARSGVLTTEQMQKAGQRLSHYEGRFKNGLETIRQHGNLTPTGAAVLEGAASYMDSAAA